MTGTKKKTPRRRSTLAALSEPEASFSPWLPEPKAELPYDKLHYELTPTLARRLADLYYLNGELESLPPGQRQRSASGLLGRAACSFADSEPEAAFQGHPTRCA